MKDWLRLAFNGDGGKKNEMQNGSEAASNDQLRAKRLHSTATVAASWSGHLHNGQQKTNVETCYGHYKSDRSGGYQPAENYSMMSN
jgi:hypothetical protein